MYFDISLCSTQHNCFRIIRNSFLIDTTTAVGFSQWLILIPQEHIDTINVENLKSIIRYASELCLKCNPLLSSFTNEDAASQLGNNGPFFE